MKRSMQRFQFGSLLTFLGLAVYSGWLTLDAKGQGFLTNSLFSVTYGNNLFVAVGEKGALCSRDGLTWQRTTGDAYFSRVTYANGVFVIAGQPCAWSTDGKSWVQFGAFGTAFSYSAAYGNGTYLASGEHYISRYGDTFPLLKSNDLTTWKTITSNSGYPFRDILFNDGFFYLYRPNQISRSSGSLETWTTVVDAGNDYSPEGRLKYSNNQYTAIVGGRVFVSTNGLDWTGKPVAAGAAISTPLGYFGIGPKGGGPSGGGVYASPDLSGWQNLGGSYFEDLTYAHGTVIAVGFNSGQGYSTIWRRNFKPEISAYFEGRDLVLQVFGEPNDGFIIETAQDLNSNQWAFADRFQNLIERSSTVITNAILTKQAYFRLKKL
jgi:hypothetical protein